MCGVTSPNFVLKSVWHQAELQTPDVSLPLCLHSLTFVCLFVQVNAPLTKPPSSSSQLHCANNNNPVSHICNVRKRALCIHGNGTCHIDAATVQKGTDAMHFSKCLLKTLQMMHSLVPAHKFLLWQCETALKVANCFLESQNSHSLYPLMDLTSGFLVWSALGSLHSNLKS